MLRLKTLWLENQPAIDHEGLADDVGRQRRGQEQRGAGHVGGGAEPLQRDPLDRAFPRRPCFPSDQRGAIAL